MTNLKTKSNNKNTSDMRTKVKGMDRKLKLIAVLMSVALLSVMITVDTTFALTAQNSSSWFWTSDTNVAATVTGDVDNDGAVEVVTGGYHNDGTRWNAQLIVWNPLTMVAKRATSWYWTSDTQVSSVAIGDADGDGQSEIITGGSFFDGTRWNAQLIVWNGSTLVAERVTSWFWTNNTAVSSVTIANITGGSSMDIVTGGSFFDGTRWNAQLIVWNGSTLVAERVTSWFWTNNTYVNSIIVANIPGSSSPSIVTGGAYHDGIRYRSQLIVWNASTLIAWKVQTWHWTSNTEITSVAVANITAGATPSIVTGGTFFDGTRTNSQLITWNSETMAVQAITTWYWFSNTKIASVAVGNYSSGTSLDIVTTGLYNDGLRNNPQLIVWNGTNLSVNSIAGWPVNLDTQTTSVALGDFGLPSKRIVVGGSYWDLTRSVAFVNIWI